LSRGTRVSAGAAVGDLARQVVTLRPAKRGAAGASRAAATAAGRGVAWRAYSSAIARRARSSGAAVARVADLAAGARDDGVTARATAARRRRLGATCARGTRRGPPAGEEDETCHGSQRERDRSTSQGLELQSPGSRRNFESFGLRASAGKGVASGIHRIRAPGIWFVSGVGFKEEAAYTEHRRNERERTTYRPEVPGKSKKSLQRDSKKLAALDRGDRSRGTGAGAAGASTMASPAMDVPVTAAPGRSLARPWRAPGARSPRIAGIVRQGCEHGGASACA
jgi:hypothetical protein